MIWDLFQAIYYLLAWAYYLFMWAMVLGILVVFLLFFVWTAAVLVFELAESFTAPEGS